MASDTEPQASKSTLADFAVLPLSLPTPPSYSHTSTHYMYIRPHAPRIPTASDTRSLFVSNIPVDATDAHFRHLFATRLGEVRVAAVRFDDARASHAAKTSAGLEMQARRGKKRKRGGEGKSGRDAEDRIDMGLPEITARSLHRSGSSAVVVFVDRASREGAWKAVRKAAASSGKKSGVKEKDRIVWSVGEDAQRALKTGSERYKQIHTATFPSTTTLQAAVDAYMPALSQLESARAAKLARQRAEPDADGFVTVTRGGRAGPARQDEAAAHLARQREREREKAAEREAGGAFYRFQVREKRKEEARELQRRFEEDASAVRGMMVEREGVFVPS